MWLLLWSDVSQTGLNLSSFRYYGFQIIWDKRLSPDGLVKCFLGQGSNVQSSKPNRSFSKNCPELTGKPSKIKFFWSFLLMSACDCKSRKFNFYNQWNIGHLRTFFLNRFVSFTSHLLVSHQSRSHKAPVVNFVVESLRRARDFFQN